LSSSKLSAAHFAVDIKQLAVRDRTELDVPIALIVAVLPSQRFTASGALREPDALLLSLSPAAVIGLRTDYHVWVDPNSWYSGTAW
jgi:hypothetical protein